MKNTKRNIALWALLSTQLLTAEPAVAQNVVNRKEDLVENLKTTEDSMNSNILKIIENNKNEIAYFTKQETKVAIIPVGNMTSVNVDSLNDMFRFVDKLRFFKPLMLKLATPKPIKAVGTIKLVKCGL